MLDPCAMGQIRRIAVPSVIPLNDKEELMNVRLNPALVLLALVLLLSGGGIHAQSGVGTAAVGAAFTYQGRLTDGGSLANGAYDLRFILYDSEVGGAQVA